MTAEEMSMSDWSADVCSAVLVAVQGQRLYEGGCSACHGVDGTGNQALGAPDLTDDYWMYGDSTAQLTESIARGRHGVMPPWRDMLGETRSRLVGAYVWSLSHPGGETATPRSEGPPSELQPLFANTYAASSLKKKKTTLTR